MCCLYYIVACMGSTEKGRGALKLGRFAVSELDLIPPTMDLDLYCTSQPLGRFLYGTME